MSDFDFLLNLSNHKNIEKIKDFLSYNTNGGKSIRQKIFNSLIKESTKESLLFSSLLEILHGSFLITDDIMDNSDLRRGQICYYKKQGMISLRYSRYFLSVLGKLIRKIYNIDNNDINLIYHNKIKLINQNDENLINNKNDNNINLINQNNENYKNDNNINLINYNNLNINLINQNNQNDNNDINLIIYNKINENLINKYYNTLFLTSLGQTLDSDKNKEYTEYIYYKISEYKTSIYTFYFPLSISYLFNKEEEPDNLYLFSKLHGIIFQMEDDLLNFKPKISKKSGTDLEERKLTYFTIKMYKEKDNKIFNKYFTKGIINKKIIEEIYLLIPEYKIKINELKKEVEKINIKLFNKINFIIEN